MYIAINTLGHTACSDCSRISDKHLVKEVNKADNFTFTVYPGDPLFDLVYPGKCSYITAYDDIENDVAFRGRITSIEPESEGNSASKAISCEGPLGYLADSIVQGLYITTNNTYRSSSGSETINETNYDLRNFIYNAFSTAMGHNAQVPADLEFSLQWDYAGNSVEEYNDTKNTICKEFHSFDGVTTLDALLELLDDIKWECYITYQMATPHFIIHFAPKFGMHVADPIVTGLNLKAMSESIDSNEIITRVFPMGGVGYDEKRLTLTSTSWPSANFFSTYGPVDPNYGAPWFITRAQGRSSNGAYYNGYIDNDKLIAKYGVHVGVKIFDDIVANDSSEVYSKRGILFQKASDYTSKLSDVEDEFDISAYDLYRAGYPLNALTLHNFYTIRDTQLDITVEARLTKQDLNYDNILDSEHTFTVQSERSSTS